MDPLTFTPYLRPQVWGGRLLGERYGKQLPAAGGYGESWEISGLPSDASVVDNGALAGTALPALLETYRDALVGTSVYARFGNRFPLEEFFQFFNPFGSFNRFFFWYLIKILRQAVDLSNIKNSIGF